MREIDDVRVTYFGARQIEELRAQLILLIGFDNIAMSRERVQKTEDCVHALVQTIGNFFERELRLLLLSEHVEHVERAADYLDVVNVFVGVLHGTTCLLHWASASTFSGFGVVPNFKPLTTILPATSLPTLTRYSRRSRIPLPDHAPATAYSSVRDSPAFSARVAAMP